MNIAQTIDYLAFEWYEKNHNVANVVILSLAAYQKFYVENIESLNHSIDHTFFIEPLDNIRARRERWDAEENGFAGFHSSVGFLRIIVIDAPGEVIEIACEIAQKEALKKVRAYIEEKRVEG